MSFEKQADPAYVEGVLAVGASLKELALTLDADHVRKHRAARDMDDHRRPIPFKPHGNNMQVGDWGVDSRIRHLLETLDVLIGNPRDPYEVGVLKV